MAVRVFVGRPSQLTSVQAQLWQRWARLLSERELALEYLGRDAYRDEPWRQLRHQIAGAAGVVVLGARQLSIVDGTWRPDTAEEHDAMPHLTSAWMQIEAGLAVMAGRPVLAIAEAGVGEGVFDPRTWTGPVRGASLDHPAVDDAVGAWIAEVTAAHG